MCDRCAAGFTFFGLAEPQAAMLEHYEAALCAGWAGADQDVAPADRLAALQRDPSAFLAALADRIDPPTSTYDAATSASASLTRWLWDGEFCGEVVLTLRGDSTGDDRFNIACVVVPGKQQNGYEDRARQQLISEARQLGLLAKVETSDR